MISCDKGLCKIDGDSFEIQADISTLIHAIDVTFTEKFGEGKAKQLIEQSIKLALENRTDDEILKTKEEFIGFLDDLKKYLEV